MRTGPLSRAWATFLFESWRDDVLARLQGEATDDWKLERPRKAFLDVAAYVRVLRHQPVADGALDQAAHASAEYASGTSEARTSTNLETLDVELRRLDAQLRARPAIIDVETSRYLRSFADFVGGIPLEECGCCFVAPEGSFPMPLAAPRVRDAPREVDWPSWGTPAWPPPRLVRAGERRAAFYDAVIDPTLNALPLAELPPVRRNWAINLLLGIADVAGALSPVGERVLETLHRNVQTDLASDIRLNSWVFDRLGVHRTTPPIAELEALAENRQDHWALFQTGAKAAISGNPRETAEGWGQLRDAVLAFCLDDPFRSDHEWEKRDMDRIRKQVVEFFST